MRGGHFQSKWRFVDDGDDDDRKEARLLLPTLHACRGRDTLSLPGTYVHSAAHRPCWTPQRLPAQCLRVQRRLQVSGSWWFVWTAQGRMIVNGLMARGLVVAGSYEGMGAWKMNE